MINGLRPLKPDARDYQFSKVFGSIDLTTLPDEFSLTALEVKDQKGTDLCTAFAACTLSELQENILLEPTYTFAKGKQLAGEYESWGLDLRLICKAAQKYGFIPADKTKYTIEDDRNVYANWNNWDQSFDILARKHAKEGYFSVGAGYSSLFDAIRAAIWQNRAEKRGVLTGAIWRSSWVSQGIIPKTYEEEGFAHAYTYIGWKKINGETYLIAHLSNGTNIGDKGIFYFPREVVDRENTFGNFTFKDMPLTLENIAIHHTGGYEFNKYASTRNLTVEQLNNAHQLRFNFKSSLGSYIGYNFFITSDGEVFQARSIGEETAAQKGSNLNTISICLAGNFIINPLDNKMVDEPTEEQKKTLVTLLVGLLDGTHSHVIAAGSKITAKLYNIHPHRFFSPTECYGGLPDNWARELVSVVYKERIGILQTLLSLYTKLVELYRSFYQPTLGGSDRECGGYFNLK